MTGTYANKHATAAHTPDNHRRIPQAYAQTGSGLLRFSSTTCTLVGREFCELPPSAPATPSSSSSSRPPPSSNAVLCFSKCEPWFVADVSGQRAAVRREQHSVYALGTDDGDDEDEEMADEEDEDDEDLGDEYVATCYFT